jgi:prepilin-type N-terminal cleavage/methylation domain-containing protein
MVMKPQHNAGFTFVELITVILIVGILGAVFAPKLFSGNAFERKAVADDLVSLFHQGRLVASRSECDVILSVTIDSVALHFDACPYASGPVLDAMGDPLYTHTGDVALLSPVTDYFINPLGAIAPAGRVIVIENNDDHDTSLDVDTLTFN